MGFISQGDNDLFHPKVRLPTVEEAALARACSNVFSSVLDKRARTQEFTLADGKGAARELLLPVSALGLVIELLEELGKGNAVRLVCVPPEMTVPEAADLLDLARYDLDTLLDEGVLPFHVTSGMRKILFDDLQAYRIAQKLSRLEALSALSELDQEQRMGYE